jgi:flagellar biosynthetic protein FliR
MGTELKLDVGTLYSFLLVLARISGAFVFVPLPGIKTGPEMARVVFAVALTFVLFPRWPVIDASGVNLPLLTGWILAEAGMGLAVGLAVSFLTEGFQMGAQIISLQAGYTFATTIDPTSGADSSVLLSIAQTTAGLLFFATGLDRLILMAFAQSLSSQPPGHFAITPSIVNGLIAMGSTIFVTGLRLVMPLMGLLLMVEISLALLARLNSHLHVMMLAFPIKMLLSLVLMAWLVLIFPKVFEHSSLQILQLIRSMLAV